MLQLLHSSLPTRLLGLVAGWLLLVASGTDAAAADSSAQEIRPDQAWTLSVRDTLGSLEDSNSDAHEALAGLGWEPGEFEVSSTPLKDDKSGADAVLRFASPRPCGDENCDVATLHWFAALDVDGKPRRAPAVVVVHESDSRQVVGKLFARAFRDKGVHAFLLSLPNYQLRKLKEPPKTTDALLVRMKQGIADVRRAYDVVAAVPCVDRDHIGLQGISLGGFVVATAACYDRTWHCVFIMLASGDIQSVIEKGGDVAEQVRKKLAEAGITQDDVKKLAWPIEPLRVAHRLDPDHTWLYTATHDEIIPIENAKRLAAVAHLAPSHHVMMPANHYSGILLYPLILNQMIEHLEK